MGDAKAGPVRLSFNPQLPVEFHGATVTSDAGQLLPATWGLVDKAGRGMRLRLEESVMIGRIYDLEQQGHDTSMTFMETGDSEAPEIIHSEVGLAQPKSRLRKGALP